MCVCIETYTHFEGLYDIYREIFFTNVNLKQLSITN